ncbi:NYN domain-containing protein [Psychromarinibacter sp. C21-152]|uniref:NYN domain-containing protein n=1 Tax=Psychromarinibacter sediminicola TaxID=3033385 RepID=A0AAE3NWS7_9RHOB|nr:NYN domain-containing protein [Psychromarinibacter sediminicola]MDF0603664.1 NYN domain-containing protein [Psychromarinibacter sediminicola]
MTRIRRIAILIDGGFFLKRLRDWPGHDRDSPSSVMGDIRLICRNHVRGLTGETCRMEESRWLYHVYRLFFYDAEPFSGAPHHPLKNRQEDFARTPEAAFRRALFDLIRRERKFALRLGHLSNDRPWTPHDRHLKQLLKIWHRADDIRDALTGARALSADEAEAARQVIEYWLALKPDDIYLPLRQKGVDMKIGLDIASMTLKRQVDTIILVTGDSDFIPAAKVARREGVEFLLDPMWRTVDGQLMEHIDGLVAGFPRPAGRR